MSTETELIAALIVEVNRIANAVEALAAAQAPAPNLRRKLADFPNFDWESLGAIVKATDRDGVSEVEYLGRLWKRRAPSNNFNSAVWFSAPFGKKADGTVNYARLITFADFAPTKRIAEDTRDVLAQGQGGTPENQPTPPPSPARQVTPPPTPIVASTTKVSVTPAPSSPAQVMATPAPAPIAKPAVAPAPAKAEAPGAARNSFYALAGEAIRAGKLDANEVNALVRTANGDGFAAALELLRSRLEQ